MITLFIMMHVTLAAVSYPSIIQGDQNWVKSYCFDTDSAGNLVVGGVTIDERLTQNDAGAPKSRPFFYYRNVGDDSVRWAKYIYPFQGNNYDQWIPVAMKFTQQTITKYNNQYIIVSVLERGGTLGKAYQVGFINPIRATTGDFQLIKVYEARKIHKTQSDGQRLFDQGNVFVRTSANQIVEVFMAHQQNGVANKIYLEKIIFTMPSNGNAETISSKHWTSVDDGDIQTQIFTANSIFVQGTTVYSGISVEYRSDDKIAYGILRVDDGFIGSLNRMDTIGCNDKGALLSDVCSSSTDQAWPRITRLDYYDRLVGMGSYHQLHTSQFKNIKNYEFLSFVFQCSSNLGQNDNFKHISFYGRNDKGSKSYYVAGLLAKSSNLVYGIINDISDDYVYLYIVNFVSVTDCNTYSISFQRKIINDWTNRRYQFFLYAQRFYDPSQTENDFGAVGWMLQNPRTYFCDGSYSGQSLGLGFVGPIDYDCSLKNVENLEIQTPQSNYKYEHTLNEILTNMMDVGSITTETPNDQTSEWSSYMNDINQGRWYGQTRPGCSFCCNSLSFPGTENINNLYPDKVYDATFSGVNSLRYAWFGSTTNFFTNSNPSQCPITTCSLKAGPTCQADLTTSIMSAFVEQPPTYSDIKIKVQRGTNYWSSTPSMPAIESMCLQCENSREKIMTNSFTVSIQCGNSAAPNTLTEGSTQVTQQADVLDTIGNQAHPTFTFKTFTQTDEIIACPILKYEISSSSSTISNLPDPFDIHYFAHSGVSQYTLTKDSGFNEEKTVTFWIHVSAEGGRTKVSSQYQLTLVCGLSSTTIYENLVTPVQTTQEVYPSKDTAFFTFDYFDVSNPACPILTHFVSKSNSAQQNLDNGLQTTLTESLYYNKNSILTKKFTLKPQNQELEQVYTFYIRVSAKGGNVKSVASTLKVNARCDLKRIDFQLPFPEKIVVQNSSAFIYDLGKHFKSSDWKYCPILSFDIKMVKNGSYEIKREIFEKTIKIDTVTGVVHFLNTKEIIERWDIYAIAKNRDIESQSLVPVMSFAVLEAPKFAPQFYRRPERITINVAEFMEGSKTSYVFEIPKYYDQNPYDSVKLNVSNYNSSWVRFDQVRERLYFENLGFDQIGIHEITLSLTDNDNKWPQTTNYTLQVLINCENTAYYTKCQQEAQNSNNTQKETLTENIIKNPQTHKLWAKIVSLSSKGILTIRFRDYMQTKSFGRFDQTILQKFFNNQTIDVYVERFNNDDFQNHSSKFNLSWHCIKYFEDELQLQIIFDHPLWISKERDVRDKLIVNLKDGKYFKSNYTRSKRAMTADFEIVNMTLADQMFDENGIEFETELSFESLVMETFIERQKIQVENQGLLMTFYILVMMITVISFFLGKMSWIIAFGYLMSLQVIVHLTFLDLKLAQNLQGFIRQIMPLALFDWLGIDFQRSQWFAKMLFDFQDQIYYPINLHATEMGIDSFNFVLILGSIFTFLVFFVVKSILMIIINSLLSQTPKCKQRTSQKSITQQVFGEFINIMKVGFFQILVGGYLNLAQVFDQQSGDKFSNIFSIVIFIIITLIWLPYQTVKVLNKPLHSFYEYNEFNEKYGQFWVRSRRKNKFQIAHFAFFFARRALVVLIIFSFELNWQIMLATITNLVMLVYLGKYQPKLTSLERSHELLNEYVILTYSTLLTTQTDWLYDPEVQYTYGWMIINYLSFFMFLNYCIVGYFIIKRVKLIAIRTKNKISYINKKFQRYRNKEQEKTEALLTQKLILVLHKVHFLEDKSLKNEEFDHIRFELTDPVNVENVIQKEPKEEKEVKEPERQKENLISKLRLKFNESIPIMMVHQEYNLDQDFDISLDNRPKSPVVLKKPIFSKIAAKVEQNMNKTQLSPKRSPRRFKGSEPKKDVVQPSPLSVLRKRLAEIDKDLQHSQPPKLKKQPMQDFLKEIDEIDNAPPKPAPKQEVSEMKRVQTQILGTEKLTYQPKLQGVMMKLNIASALKKRIQSIGSKGSVNNQVHSEKSLELNNSVNILDLGQSNKDNLSVNSVNFDFLTKGQKNTLEWERKFKESLQSRYFKEPIKTYNQVVQRPQLTDYAAKFRNSNSLQNSARSQLSDDSNKWKEIYPKLRSQSVEMKDDQQAPKVFNLRDTINKIIENQAYKDKTNFIPPQSTRAVDLGKQNSFLRNPYQGRLVTNAAVEVQGIGIKTVKNRNEGKFVFQ